MITRTVLGVAALVFISSAVYGMDADQFDELMLSIKNGQDNQVAKFLREREEALERDPDYYVILLNYALSQGDQANPVIAKGHPKKGALALVDPETGDTVGYVAERSDPDEQVVTDAISKTQAALPFFESRLDIRFGLVTAAESIARWDIVGDQLAEVLKVSRAIDNKWTWGRIDSMSHDPQAFMLENVQANTSTLFDKDDPVADDALIKASLAMVKFYPEVIYGYSNLGVIHLARDEYDKAEAYLLEALEINPDDEIVRSNLAFLKESASSESTS